MPSSTSSHPDQYGVGPHSDRPWNAYGAVDYAHHPESNPPKNNQSTLLTTESTTRLLYM
ncbi:hypothetical protein F4814DRAFT_430822, partial [Daldinia grandis]